MAAGTASEERPTPPPAHHRHQDIRFAQRASRKMLNVLSFTYVLDAPDVPHLRLLEPFAKEVKVRSSMAGMRW